MRSIAFALTFLLTSPALAEDVAYLDAAPLGLGVTQNGEALMLEERNGALVAELLPEPFVLTFTDAQPDVVAVTFGREGLFDMLDLPPETGLFGPGTAYARTEGPDAVHFMTDPLCGSEYYGPGFNILDESRRTTEGFPVRALMVGSASRRCDAEDRLPSDVNLMGVVGTLYAVVRTDAGDTRLILRFVGS